MCQDSNYNADKLCVSSCPAYFYFPLIRTQAASLITSVLNFRYNNYTNIAFASETYINGSNDATSYTEAYRLGTNFCMLCDYRCIKCVGPLNTDCSKCRNYFYLWMNNTVCDDICPIGQYIALDHSYPSN
jgi:hypothetical protein